jgi:hypothetical protein
MQILLFEWLLTSKYYNFSLTPMELSEAIFLEGIFKNKDCPEYAKRNFHFLMKFLIIFKIMAYEAWQ